MAIPLPTPSVVVGLTRSALDQALGSAASMAAVPARAFAVLDGVEALLARINGVVDRIETTLDRTDQVVAKADAVADRAAGTVQTAAEAATTAADLMSAYEPALRRAAPMTERFVEQLSHEEVTAAIHLIDELPKLKEHLTADILPILATLDRVGPDLHDLLDVTRDLKLAVAGIPGLGMLRRRGEKLVDDPAL
jgi:argininosuccinate lyase